MNYKSLFSACLLGLLVGSLNLSCQDKDNPSNLPIEDCRSKPCDSVRVPVVMDSALYKSLIYNVTMNWDRLDMDQLPSTNFIIKDKDEYDRVLRAFSNQEKPEIDFSKYILAVAFVRYPQEVERMSLKVDAVCCDYYFNYIVKVYPLALEGNYFYDFAVLPRTSGTVVFNIKIEKK